jgi:hypothetical protein
VITAIDTNVLLGILRPNPDFYDAAAQALEASVPIGAPVLPAGLALAACYASARMALRTDTAIALRRD